GAGYGPDRVIGYGDRKDLALAAGLREAAGCSLSERLDASAGGFHCPRNHLGDSSAGRYPRSRKSSPRAPGPHQRNRGERLPLHVESLMLAVWSPADCRQSTVDFLSVT